MTNALSEYIGVDEKLDPTSYHAFPEYDQPKYDAPYILEIQMDTEDDLRKFVELVAVGSESILDDGARSVKCIWYPKLFNGERGSNAQYIWVQC